MTASLLSTICTLLLALPEVPVEVRRELDTLSQCHDVNDEACLVAASRLVVLGDATVLPLADRLESMSQAGQLLGMTVCEALGPAAYDVVLRIAKSKKADPVVRALALDGLAKRGDLRVRALALTAAKDREPLVRQAAVRIVANAVTPRDAKLIAVLTKAARDKAPAVRAEAAYGLGFCGCRAAGPALSSALTDPELAVRRAAAEALSFVKHDAAVPKLVARLREEDELLVRSSARALRYQTAENLGDDALGWEQWLAQHHR